MERESPSHPGVRILDTYFRMAGGVLRLISDSLLTGKLVKTAETPLPALEATTQELRDASGSATAPFLSAVLREARHQMTALNGQLRAAMELANNATPVGEAEFAKREAEQPWWLGFRGSLATLRANLNWKSSAFRHAVRLCVCVVAGDLVGRRSDWQRSYWLPMTVVIVLKPDFSSTFSRGCCALWER